MFNNLMVEQSANLSAILSAAADARRSGDRTGEMRWLSQAMQMAPDDPLTLNAHGISALASEAFSNAIAYFSAAAKIDSKEPALWMNLAAAFRGAGDDGAEQSSLEHVLSIDRRHFMAQLRMAELKQRQGQNAAAAQSWSNVVQLATAIEHKPELVADALSRGQSFLSQHNKSISDSLDRSLGDRLASMSEGARRFKACVDHSLGRRAIYTNQCAGVQFPFLPADEFFEDAHFPWFPEIERHTDAIAREAMALVTSGSDMVRPYVRMPDGSPQTKWSPLDGSLNWGACFLWEYGVRNDPVCDQCPTTAAALSAIAQPQIAGKSPSAFFSILQPGAHIPPHTGVTNTRAIVHLPLIIPNNCSFRVGGETRQWVTGKAFAFDDTIEHEAWNQSDQARLILIFEVWNPHLTVEERELLTEFYAITGSVD
ncbi:aspartyl/asparaginyl beta-hydroxylase domain-containing protein [Sphingobium sp. BS19]|uniref:aspartyl/asparaginyl beta-hydroxylase domain-containing protein n=1 Tax=Sphingobium sp. BS19 TaxID=3018973 RepID=UPI002490F1BB|nr:aspartyl/asparaginyl beta-hydroxylase domain-containing protein [Sphingobium sp. BS19]